MVRRGPFSGSQTSCCILECQKELRSSLDLLCYGTNLIHEAPTHPHSLSTAQGLHLLISSHKTSEFQHMNLEEDTNIQTITLGHKKDTSTWHPSPPAFSVSLSLR